MTQDLDQNLNADKGLFNDLAADSPLVDPKDDRLGCASFANIEPAAILDKCQNLMHSPPEWMTERQQLAVRTFLKGMELQKTGEPEHRWDWDED